jgi:dissimilatory sulfite reductase (desulfoviridin) alpha/beta subunit
MGHVENEEQKEVNLTILLPAGRLSLPVLHKVNELAQEYKLGLYFSNAQNLRLLGIKEDTLDDIKKQLAQVGVEFKGPGKFPLPKVCVGKPHCNLGIIDTESLSNRITNHFKNRTNVKPKFKIALSGCTLSCSGSLLADIGVVATRQGFDVYVGGKGGPSPKVGQKVASNYDENQVIDIIEKLVDFHDAKTGKKQRMVKLFNDPDFYFSKTG